MRSSDAIRADIRIQTARLDELKSELRAAELAECEIPFKVGDRIKHRGQEYEISFISPWGRTDAWIKGHKIRTNGKLALSTVSIGSSSEIIRATQLKPHSV